MSHWEYISYGEFTIALEPWGDGNFNAHLTDNANGWLDHGMVASYMSRDKAIKEAQTVADAIKTDPDRFVDEDGDYAPVVPVAEGEQGQ